MSLIESHVVRVVSLVALLLVSGFGGALIFSGYGTEDEDSAQPSAATAYTATGAGELSAAAPLPRLAHTTPRRPPRRAGPAPGNTGEQRPPAATEPPRVSPPPTQAPTPTGTTKPDEQGTTKIGE